MNKHSKLKVSFLSVFVFFLLSFFLLLSLTVLYCFERFFISHQRANFLPFFYILFFSFSSLFPALKCISKERTKIRKKVELESCDLLVTNKHTNRAFVTCEMVPFWHYDMRERSSSLFSLFVCCNFSQCFNEFCLFHVWDWSQHTSD